MTPMGSPPSPVHAPPTGGAGSGCDVTLASTFTMPATCASCGAPKQTALNTSKTKGWIGPSRTRWIAVPYCDPCARRVKAARRAGKIQMAIALLGAAAFPAIGFLVTGLSVSTLAGIGLVWAVGLALGTRTRLAPEPPRPPATAAGDAVRLVKFDRYRSVVHCSSGAWGAELARLNNVPATPKTRRFPFGVRSVVFAALLAPLAALFVWETAHPTIHVDNAGAEAMDIWVDGAVRATAQAGGRTEVRVAYGRHMFGHSVPSAPRAEGAFEADTPMNDDYLYNPEKTACYELVANTYGSASIAKVPHGPQPIREFYRFDHIDTWFADNPNSVQVGTFEFGATRVAVQRREDCGEPAGRTEPGASPPSPTLEAPPRSPAQHAVSPRRAVDHADAGRPHGSP